MEPSQNNYRPQKGSFLKLLIIILIAFSMGYMLGDFDAEQQPLSESDITNLAESKPQVWTCSMHPQIRQPKVGLCPLCAMDLIPVDTDSGGNNDNVSELTLSPNAGKLEYNESRLGYIDAWVPGRLDRLYADYTGIPVKKGDHMVNMYSPDLFSAQQELIQSIKAFNGLKKSGLTIMKETAEQTVTAAREKLALLGLKEWQIEKIVKTGKPSDHMTIYAPMSGIVVHKNAVEGMYVNTGTRIYTIADLTQLWLKLDVYESDLSWIRYGQDVEFKTDAYPGEIFEGKISFIDPVLNALTRTVKVRVNVPNQDGKLKPEMFVHAVVKTSVASGGKVMDAELSGKWICPMHPEIIKGNRGSCSICGMPLESSESLGYTSVNETMIEAPLIIPASAPLITGKRAVVYIEDPESRFPTQKRPPMRDVRSSWVRVPGITT